jgi:hypothetical protein
MVNEMKVYLVYSTDGSFPCVNPFLEIVFATETKADIYIGLQESLSELTEEYREYYKVESRAL